MRIYSDHLKVEMWEFVLKFIFWKVSLTLSNVCPPKIESSEIFHPNNSPLQLALTPKGQVYWCPIIQVLTKQTKSWENAYFYSSTLPTAGAAIATIRYSIVRSSDVLQWLRNHHFVFQSKFARCIFFKNEFIVYILGQEALCHCLALLHSIPS